MEKTNIKYTINIFLICIFVLMFARLYIGAISYLLSLSTISSILLLIFTYNSLFTRKIDDYTLYYFSKRLIPFFLLIYAIILKFNIDIISSHHFGYLPSLLLFSNFLFYSFWMIIPIQLLLIFFNFIVLYKKKVLTKKISLKLITLTIVLFDFELLFYFLNDKVFITY
ncbi:MAG: hypothetical protein D8M58_10495 [Calditrichaeota bacterium]|nr:MAG: hypothetical protein DWQ03_09870 [Calditrichota bacterium]MBL1205819.1 hypothetical protein [Calditrichota bacterium]